MKLKMKKKLQEDLAIIILPIFLVMMIITLGIMSMSELARWDIAISIGAIVSLLIFHIKGRR